MCFFIKYTFNQTWNTMYHQTCIFNFILLGISSTLLLFVKNRGWGVLLNKNICWQSLNLIWSLSQTKSVSYRKSLVTSNAKSQNWYTTPATKQYFKALRWTYSRKFIFMQNCIFKSKPNLVLLLLNSGVQKFSWSNNNFKVWPNNIFKVWPSSLQLPIIQTARLELYKPANLILPKKALDSFH